MGLFNVAKRVFGLRRWNTDTQPKLLLEWHHYSSFDWATAEPLMTWTPNKLKVFRPHDWWRTYGGKFPMLQKIALHIMHGRAGSHSIESVFSVLGNIQSKRRPRMNNSTAKQLAYCNVNRRVLANMGNVENYINEMEQRKLEAYEAESDDDDDGDEYNDEYTAATVVSTIDDHDDE